MEDQDLIKLLDQLVKNTTLIVASPKTIEEMKAKGAKIKSSKKTKKEFLDDLFKERRQVAELQIDGLPPLSDTANQTFQFLYHEIVECILFGLNGSAITLSGILVEYALKHAVVKRRASLGEKESDLQDFIEGIDFGQAIDQADKYKVITPEEKVELTNFKDGVRNPYNHYNIKKIVTGVVAGKTKVLNIYTGAVEEKDLLAEENPQLWFAAKKFKDKTFVLRIFSFTDKWSKKLLN